MSVMYLLLDNPRGADLRFNVGDDIQAVAASHHMPAVGGLVLKEQISAYAGPAGKIILNGWFMHDTAGWPPPERLQTLITSFHISPPAARQMLAGEGLKYMRARAPIGCRDLYTMRTLESFGVPAFLSGCLTLTLDRSRFVAPSAKREGVFVVDLLYKRDDRLRRSSLPRRLANLLAGNYVRLRARKRNILERLVGKARMPDVQLRRHSIFMAHDDHNERRKIAEELLREYANAELVVTSRIHCALPCLAFGTPVIFVDAELDASAERARVDSILELFHVVKVSDGNEVIIPDSLRNGCFGLSNKPDYIRFREDLIRQVRGFFNA